MKEMFSPACIAHGALSDMPASFVADERTPMGASPIASNIEVSVSSSDFPKAQPLSL
jgi:hypothetical protein